MTNNTVPMVPGECLAALMKAISLSLDAQSSIMIELLEKSNENLDDNKNLQANILAASIALKAQHEELSKAYHEFVQTIIEISTITEKGN